jgi:hypothetical protein
MIADSDIFSENKTPIGLSQSGFHYFYSIFPHFPLLEQLPQPQLQ